MRRRRLLTLLLIAAADAALGQASVSPVEPRDRAENRVGRRYWARPALDSTSVDFYAERELRTRIAIYDKRALRILDIEAVDAAGGKQIVYRLRFDGGGEAYIDAADFDRRLYRELAPNQVMTAPPDSPVGATPQQWTFQRSSLFAADPDVIWERIRNEGPRTFTPDPPRRRRKPVDVPPSPKPAKP